MKRTISFLAVLCIVLLAISSAVADYYTLPTEGQIVLQDTADRMIVPLGTDDSGQIIANPVIAGESPVTGLPWTGIYLPMMVMINNASGGVNKVTPWGTQYADVTYETLHTRDGVTRMVEVFSDTVPDSVGPVRSVRNSGVMIHSEWMCGFVFWGGPKVDRNNIVEFFNQTGARKLGILFDGVGVAAGVPPETLWNRVEGVMSSADLNVNLSGIRDLISADYVAPSRPFLFTDERLYDDRASVLYFSLDYGSGGNITHFAYDEATDSYVRTIDVDGETMQYMAYTTSTGRQTRNADEMVPLTYQNVIVQRVKYTFANNHGSMPLMEALGSGNADIFIGGRYIAGYWVRTDLASPTYYFDETGNQIRLTRGKTFIAMFPDVARLCYPEVE